MQIRTALCAGGAAVCLFAPLPAALAQDPDDAAYLGRGEVFVQETLVANRVKYCPAIVEPTMRNAWGLAIRPAGAGGHWWVASNGGGTSIEYVGDVGGVPLFQDGLKVVGVPGPGQSQGSPTGIVFNGGTGFVVTQPHPSGPITAPAKFITVTNNGVISAWTERARPAGGFDRPDAFTSVLDDSANGAQFFGVGVTTAGDLLLVADFGSRPRLRLFDATFAETTDLPATAGQFANPFIRQALALPGDYVPFNVQVLRRGGSDRVFVVYAKSQADPGNPGHFLAGEEDAGPGKGRIAEFDRHGRLLAIWQHRGLLNAPWGFQYAPTGFGRFSGHLLVSNFGDGTVTAFDPHSRRAVGQLRDPFGHPFRLAGIWGLQFGNGASLGEANHLYYGAGPRDEQDGVFGKISPVKLGSSNDREALARWLAGHYPCRRPVNGTPTIMTCARPCP